MDPNTLQPGVQSPDAQQPVMQQPDVQGVVPTQGQNNQLDQNGQPVTDQQKQALLDLITTIRQKIGSFNALRFASDNKTETMRRDLLGQVFQKLQAAGVDLTDKDSVSNFLAKLHENNPELAQIFETAMDALLGGQEGGSYATPADSNSTVNLDTAQNQNMNNENPNENISQNLS